MTDLEAQWKLPVWALPGASFLYNVGRKHPSTRRWHICGIVDTDMLVLKSWSARRGWIYKVESPLYLTMCPHMITNIKKAKVAS